MRKRIFEMLEAGSLLKNVTKIIESMSYTIDECISFDENGNIECLIYPNNPLEHHYTYTRINGFYMVSTLEVDQIGRWTYKYDTNNNPVFVSTPWSMGIGPDCVDDVPIFLEEFTRQLSGNSCTADSVTTGMYPIPMTAAIAYPSWCKSDLMTFIGDDFNKVADGRHLIGLVVSENACYVKVSKLADDVTMIRRDIF